MTYARWTFRLAGIYGLLVLVPQYFLADQIGRSDPPPLTHLEFFYGFVGIAIAWQLAFLIIAHDPARYRPLMLAAIVEKATFSIATFILFAQQRLSLNMLAAGSIDCLLGVLFAIAWLRTTPHPNPNA
jgi:hypothetical protein